MGSVWTVVVSEVERNCKMSWLPELDTWRRCLLSLGYVREAQFVVECDRQALHCSDVSRFVFVILFRVVLLKKGSSKTFRTSLFHKSCRGQLGRQEVIERLGEKVMWISSRVVSSLG